MAINPVHEVPIIKIGTSNKYQSHISLGNDPNDWESVSKNTLIKHSEKDKKSLSEYEMLEKSKSTVLDNPDLLIEPLRSVHQEGNLQIFIEEFRIPENLDWKSLMYDNTFSKKALNGTNFSVDL